MRPISLTPSKILGLLALAAAATLYLSGPSHAADLNGVPPQKVDAQGNVVKPLSWFGGASIGANFNAAQLDSGPVRIDLGAQDYQVGVEAGFDYRLVGPFSIGGLARYDWTNAKASLLGTDASYNGIWTAAAKFTYHVNAGAEAYGLLGYSGTTFKLDDISDTKRGFVYGLGLEIKISESPVNIFAEWARTEFKAEDLGGVTFKPSVDVARIGTRIRF